jgi:hypothetical protein
VTQDAAGQKAQRITHGDVQAVFEAFGNGGRAILQHSRTAQGAPADFFGSHGAIRPFAGSPWDGAHFCAEDWHVIQVADIEGGDHTFKQQHAKDIIDALTIDFTLDGAPLPTTRTAVKRFNNPEQFDLEVAYYAQEGRIMSPGDLAVGQHTLSVTFGDSTGTTTDGITFFVDASGTGACM